MRIRGSGWVRWYIGRLLREKIVRSLLLGDLLMLSGWFKSTCSDDAFTEKNIVRISGASIEHSNESLLKESVTKASSLMLQK